MAAFLDDKGVVHEDTYGHIRTKCGLYVVAGRTSDGNFREQMKPMPEGTKVDCFLCLGWVEPPRRDTTSALNMPNMQQMPREKKR